VSEEVATRAGLDLSSFPSHEIEVRGRTTLMTIRVVPNALDLELLLAGHQPAVAQTG
jgi:hypothetical protein